jgi:predicted RNase H-like HicB family nuclease
MRQVLVYQDEEGFWIAEVPSLPGCGSDGTTRQEVLNDVKEAIDLWIEDALANDESIPEDLSPIAVELV